MDGRDKKYIKSGIKVAIVQTQDKRSGQLTHGVVMDVLTTSPFHLQGIEVRLKTGQVGRVKEIKR